MTVNGANLTFEVCDMLERVPPTSTHGSVTLEQRVDTGTFKGCIHCTHSHVQRHTHTHTHTQCDGTHPFLHWRAGQTARTESLDVTTTTTTIVVEVAWPLQEPRHSDGKGVGTRAQLGGWSPPIPTAGHLRGPIITSSATLHDQREKIPTGPQVYLESTSHTRTFCNMLQHR